MQFGELVGGKINVVVPRIDSRRWITLKIIGVEPAGLWVQSDELTAGVLKLLQVASAPRTPVLFLPFHEISIAISSIPDVALDEKAFGL